MINAAQKKKPLENPQVARLRVIADAFRAGLDEAGDEVVHVPVVDPDNPELHRITWPCRCRSPGPIA